ncbi:relaxase/mobilization nuclease domain-containing protein [Saccharopolyspora shandongensis]|uniref:relaxase/mobilization nuclease domain-containing protein n=1 Tax=Saccharopolyspora shandongensis TaxID=418495 RepID=UPI0033E551DF
MIAKVSRGRHLGGLLRYLFGPGRANEHIDPHLVGAWDTGWLPEGVFAADLEQRGGLARLARMLDAPRVAHDMPVNGGHVYHVPISLPSDDGRLSDATWRKLVHEAVVSMGFQHCRWVAVHHGRSAQGNDHVHLVVNLVDEHGQVVNTYRDWPRWRRWCRWTEQRMNLTPTAPAGAGRKATSRAEIDRARREGRHVTDRYELRRVVHSAAAHARTELEFFEQLRTHGVRFRPRTDRAGRLIGYSVALTDDHRRPRLWLAGSSLRRDLSLPRLQARWRSHPLSARPDITAAQQLRFHLDAATDELRGYLQQSGHTAEHWHAAAQDVANLTVIAANWNPPLSLVADHLAMAAQPPQRRDERLRTLGVVLPTIVEAGYLAVASGPLGLLMATLIFTIFALVTALIAAIEHYQIHASAQRHVAQAHRWLSMQPAAHTAPVPETLESTPQPKVTRSPTVSSQSRRRLPPALQLRRASPQQHRAPRR